MHINTLHLYTVHSILYRSLVQDSREYYTGTNISGSAHLQGRQWVDMSGWSEGSEVKGEVCVKCEGWAELGGDHRKVAIPI